MKKKVGLAIKAAIAEMGTTIGEVAPQVGLTYDKLSNIINGRTKLSDRDAERLRKLFDKPDGWPLYAGHELEGIPLVEIEVVGAAAAGRGGVAIESKHPPLRVPANLAGGRRKGWVVDGPSMYPHIHPGDTVVVEPSPFPRNKLTFLYFHEGSACVKQLVYKSGELFTHPFNPSMEDERFPDGAIIYGYVVGIYGKRGSGEMILVDPSGIRFDDFS